MPSLRTDIVPCCQPVPVLRYRALWEFLTLLNLGIRPLPYFVRLYYFIITLGPRGDPLRFVARLLLSFLSYPVQRYVLAICMHP